jgi:hypothetical protein
VPGVNLIATPTFLAAIGEIGRFSSSRRLRAYLGWTRACATYTADPARDPPRRSACSAAWPQPPTPRERRQRPDAHIRSDHATRPDVQHATPAPRLLQWPSGGHPAAGSPRSRNRPGSDRDRRTQPDIRDSGHENGAGSRLFWSRPPARAHRRQPALHARGRRHMARQRRRPPGRARTRPPGRDRIRTHRARLPRHPSQQSGRERDTGTRIIRPSERQAARQGIGPRPCALARRRPRAPETVARSAQRVQPPLTFSVPESDAGASDPRLETLASVRRSTPPPRGGRHVWRRQTATASLAWLP